MTRMRAIDPDELENEADSNQEDLAALGMSVRDEDKDDLEEAGDAVVVAVDDEDEGV